jgi:urea transport system ATP-binding protein
MLLGLEGVSAAYGGTVICQEVRLTVDCGEVVCLLGRNGVGKTTLLRSIMGIVPNGGGRILFNDRDISALPSYARAKAGLAYVPQGRLIFPQLTVAENLRSGTLIGGDGSFREVADAVFDYFPRLRERLGQRAGSLSGGEQQMLAIGRALGGRPSLLLLDEPSEGIQPTIVQQIRDLIVRLASERQLGVLLVEQNLKFAGGASARGYVMDKGQIVAEGSVAEISREAVVAEHLTFEDRTSSGAVDGHP